MVSVSECGVRERSGVRQLRHDTKDGLQHIVRVREALLKVARRQEGRRAIVIGVVADLMTFIEDAMNVGLVR